MTDLDPRSLGDRQLLAYLALGPLPRSGWPGRRRLIVRRVLALALTAVGVAFFLAVARLVVIVLWAASL